MANFSPPLPPLAGNPPGSSGADSSAFGAFSNNFSGMGNPMTPKSVFSAEDEKYLEGMDPNIKGLLYLQQKQQSMYEDPQRLRELMGIYKEFRAEEAEKANKMALQRQALATISQTGQNLAVMMYNPERQRILANIPNQMIAAYNTIPWNPIPRRTSFR